MVTKRDEQMKKMPTKVEQGATSLNHDRPSVFET
jgi:hypothetical protein